MIKGAPFSRIEGCTLDIDLPLLGYDFEMIEQPAPAGEKVQTNSPPSAVSL
jgi:hypothetical protein